MCRSELASSGLGEGLLLGFFQHDDEFSFSVKGGEFLNEKNDCLILKWNCHLKSVTKALCSVFYVLIYLYGHI